MAIDPNLPVEDCPMLSSNKLRLIVGAHSNSWQMLLTRKIAPPPDYDTTSAKLWHNTPKLQRWIEDIKAFKEAGNHWVNFQTWTEYEKTTT